jgi:predicted dehydrogenase
MIRAMKPIRIVQVGLGGWGKNWYTHVLKDFQDVEVVAFVDSSREALAAAQELFGIASDRFFTTLSGALADSETDAVVITASLPGHIPNALAALESGKHVLTEKPFAPSLKEADRAIATAEKAGKVLMVSQNYRFYPAPRKLLEIVENGDLGELGTIHVDFRRDKVEYNERSKRHYNLEDPLLADMAIHHFDLMRMVTLSDPKSLSFYTHNPPWSHYVHPPAANGTIEFENGVVASYRGSWVSPGPITPWAGEWRMEFARGEVTWTSRRDDTAAADVVRVRELGKREREIPLDPMPHLDRAGSLAEFVRAIRDGGEYENSGAENRASLAMVFSAIESAKKQRPVQVGV